MPSLLDDNAQTLARRDAQRGLDKGVVKVYSGPASAEVLAFDAPVSRSAKLEHAAEFTDLAQARSARNARRTHSGVFVYVPRL